MNSKDPKEGSVLDAFINAVAQTRKRKDKYLELELRVGNITDKNTFKAGYGSKIYIECMRRLFLALRHSVKHKEEWTEEPQQAFIRSYFTSELRMTAMPKHDPVYCMKSKQFNVDVQTNYPTGDLRLSLSREVPFDPTKPFQASSLVTNVAPKYVRFYRRSRFTYTVDFQGNKLLFHLDLSMVSPPGENKKSCTGKECEYHLEVELGNFLAPMEDKQRESEEDRFIAATLLDLGKRLLGSSKTASSDNGDVRHEPLPPLVIAVFNK